MDKLTQEFAQFKAHFAHKWVQCPGCHGYHVKRLEIPEIGERLLECSQCNLVWRCLGESEQRDRLQWQHILRGQQIVNHWAHRGKSTTCP